MKDLKGINEITVLRLRNGYLISPIRQDRLVSYDEYIFQEGFNVDTLAYNISLMLTDKVVVHNQKD